MPSCDGYAGRYILGNGDIPCGFGALLEQDNLRSLTLEDGVLGGNVVLTTSHAVSLRAHPYFTVSQSEAGFEKIMQAVEITLTVPVGDEVVSLSVEVHATR